MNEPGCIPDHAVEVPQVHCLARFIKPERKTNRLAGTARRNLFVRTLNVLKIMGDNIDQLELARLLAPGLTDNRRRCPLSVAARSMAWKIATQARYA